MIGPCIQIYRLITSTFLNAFDPKYLIPKTTIRWQFLGPPCNCEEFTRIHHDHGTIIGAFTRGTSSNQTLAPSPPGGGPSGAPCGGEHRQDPRPHHPGRCGSGGLHHVLPAVGASGGLRGAERVVSQHHGGEDL